ncbi:MAG: hypothetical protein A2081_05155 [Elusimicrobia bacterium GWC2_61_19]|nr:MAG: hypothetical protein A2081_05155 [Elusimicrobia bacterium GWC2_61_19]
MINLNKRSKYALIGAVLLAPLLFAYFYGPKSELTLLARLHYNTLFVYTPCLGRAETYDDGAVKFNYIRPPELLSHTAVLFMDPYAAGTTTPWHKGAKEVVDLGLPSGPLGTVYRFIPPAGSPVLSASGPGARAIKLKKGEGVIRTEEPSFKNYRPEFLYVSGKNGYIYRLPLPFYLERIVDRSWLFPALYHSGILSLLMPGSYTDLLPPRGFLKWFFTPSADKQLSCSGEAMLRSIEVSDRGK